MNFRTRCRFSCFSGHIFYVPLDEEANDDPPVFAIDINDLNFLDRVFKNVGDVSSQA